MRNFGLPTLSSLKCFSIDCGVFLIIVHIAAATAADADDKYSDVTGRIVLQGEVPKLLPLVGRGNIMGRNPALCGALHIPNDSLVIHSENRGIQNVLVYLRKAPKEAIPPAIEKRKNQPLKVSLKNCRFSPHTMVVRDDQQVFFE